MEDLLESLYNWRPHFNMPSVPGVVLMVVSLLLYFFVKRISRAIYPADEKKAEKAELYLRFVCIGVLAAGAAIAIYMI